MCEMSGILRFDPGLPPGTLTKNWTLGLPDCDPLFPGGPLLKEGLSGLDPAPTGNGLKNWGRLVGETEFEAGLTSSGKWTRCLCEGAAPRDLNPIFGLGLGRGALVVFAVVLVWDIFLLMASNNSFLISSVVCLSNLGFGGGGGGVDGVEVVVTTFSVTTSSVSVVSLGDDCTVLIVDESVTVGDFVLVA